MPSLAENIKPPFYAATLNDNTSKRIEDENHVAPSDEMTSLAPAQPGFLGLETTQDKTGAPVSVSYWRDMRALKAWEKRGDFEIRKRFSGVGLDETCALKITKIDGKQNHGISQPHTPAARSLGILSSGLITLFPALAGLFGYEQII